VPLEKLSLGVSNPYCFPNPRRRPSTDLAEDNPGSSVFERVKDSVGSAKHHGYSLVELPNQGHRTSGFD
jgi:hypothetical protein